MYIYINIWHVYVFIIIERERERDIYKYIKHTYVYIYIYIILSWNRKGSQHFFYIFYIMPLENEHVKQMLAENVQQMFPYRTTKCKTNVT